MGTSFLRRPPATHWEREPPTLRFRHTFMMTAVSAAALSALAFGAVACSDDGGSEEDEQAIQASIDAINQAQLDGNVENIDQYLTEDGAKNIFFSSLEDIKA